MINQKESKQVRVDPWLLKLLSRDMTVSFFFPLDIYEDTF